MMLSLLLCGLVLADTVPTVLTEPLTDTVDALSASEEEHILGRLAALEKNERLRLAIVLVDSPGDRTLESVTQGLALEWQKSSSKADSAVLVFAMDDRRSHLFCDYTRNQCLPAREVQGLLDGLRPALAAGRTADAMEKIVVDLGTARHEGTPARRFGRQVKRWVSMAALFLGIAWIMKWLGWRNSVLGGIGALRIHHYRRRYGGGGASSSW